MFDEKTCEKWLGIGCTAIVAIIVLLVVAVIVLAMFVID